jgi:hypothetical protein
VFCVWKKKKKTKPSKTEREREERFVCIFGLKNGLKNRVHHSWGTSNWWTTAGWTPQNSLQNGDFQSGHWVGVLRTRKYQSAGGRVRATRLRHEVKITARPSHRQLRV